MMATILDYYLALQMSVCFGDNGDVLDGRSDSIGGDLAYSDVSVSNAWDSTSKRSRPSLFQGIYYDSLNMTHQ